MLQTEVVEKIETHFVLNNFFLENRAVYAIMRKNIVELDRPRMTVWRMRGNAVLLSTVLRKRLSEVFYINLLAQDLFF